MAFIDDLAKANAVLDEGIKSFTESKQKLAQQRLLQEAQNQIDFIKENEGNEFKQQKQLKDLAQNFANQFLQAGGTAAQTKMVQNLFEPAEDPFFQTVEQAEIATAKRLSKTPEEFEERLEEIRGRKTSATVAKEKTKQQFATQDRIDKISKRFTSKTNKAEEAFNQANTAIEILQNPEVNPIGDVAIKTFMARATGEVGNLTEAEREAFGGSQAIVSRVKQISKSFFDGTLTGENRKYLTNLAEVMRKAQVRSIRGAAEDLVTDRGAELLGMTKQELLNEVLPDRFKETGEAAAGPLPAKQILKELDNTGRTNLRKKAKALKIDQAVISKLLRGELSDAETTDILKKIKGVR